MYLWGVIYVLLIVAWIDALRPYSIKIVLGLYSGEVRWSTLEFIEVRKFVYVFR